MLDELACLFLIATFLIYKYKLWEYFCCESTLSHLFLFTEHFTHKHRNADSRQLQTPGNLSFVTIFCILLARVKHECAQAHKEIVLSPTRSQILYPESNQNDKKPLCSDLRAGCCLMSELWKVQPISLCCISGDDSPSPSGTHFFHNGREPPRRLRAGPADATYLSRSLGRTSSRYSFSARNKKHTVRKLPNQNSVSLTPGKGRKKNSSHLFLC